MLTLVALGAVTHANVQDAYPPIVTEKNLYAATDFRGKPAPEFVVGQWLSDKPEMKGKILFIDFWATWCGPCKALIPKVNDWHAKYGKEVVFIGLSDEPAETVTKFQATTKMNYPQAIDPDRRLHKALGVKGIPHVMIVTPDGVVRWQGFPGSAEDPLTEEKLKQIIAASKIAR